MTTSPTPRPEPEAAVRQTPMERLRRAYEAYDRWEKHFHVFRPAILTEFCDAAEALLAAPQPQPVDERPMLRELREWLLGNDDVSNSCARMTLRKIDELLASPPPSSPRVEDQSEASELSVIAGIDMVIDHARGDKVSDAVRRLATSYVEQIKRAEKAEARCEALAKECDWHGIRTMEKRAEKAEAALAEAQSKRPKEGTVVVETGHFLNLREAAEVTVPVLERTIRVLAKLLAEAPQP